MKTLNEMEKKLEALAKEYTGHARLFKALGKPSDAYGCMRRAAAYMACLHILKEIRNNDEEDHLLHGSGADQRRSRS